MLRGGILFIGLWAAAAAYAAGPTGYAGAEADYSVANVASLLNSKSPPLTLEETISRIHDESPRMFENVVLMYRSKSFQVSSAEFPRAILFNTDASFVMAFNGHASQRGNDRLEMMQFDSVAKRFAFYEVRKVGGKITLSAPNPQLCVGCHQSPERKDIDPRPNWEPYSRWPGAIGSEQDQLRPYFQPEIYRPEDELHKSEAVREQEVLANFIRSQNAHPRYKFLKLPEMKVMFHLATDFTDLLGRLNFYRVERLARTDAAAHYQSIKYLLGGVVRCGRMYMSESVLKKWEEKTPDESTEFVVRGLDMLRRRIKVPRYVWGGERENGRKTRYILEPAKFPGITPSEGLWLLYEPFGVDISDWSMDFRTSGRMAFSERFGLPSSAAQAVLEAFTTMENEATKLSCDELEPLALAQAEALESLPVQPRAEPKPLINACIRCHTQFDNPQAPWIPFDDPNALKFALRKPVKNGRLLLEEIRFRLSDHANVDEQMPMGLVRPSEKSRRELVGYLESVSSSDGP